MKWVIPFALASLVAFGATAELDLGDLDQYNGRLKNPPVLSENTVWLSGKEGDGFDVVLSPDAREKVQKILDGCAQADNKCYQDVREVLHSAHLEIDGHLERRHFGHLLSKTFTSVAAVFFQIVNALTANWDTRHQEVEEMGVYIPEAKASEAAELATAPEVVVSAGGSLVMTITPTPDPTTLQGAHTPSVTPVTEASQGWSKGDLKIILDKDLALRVDEIMHRLTDCEDGRKFDSDHPSKKRAKVSLGQAICGAIGAATMVAPGGTLNDLLLLQMDQLRFAFADAVGNVGQAATVVGDFLIDYAPMLGIEPEFAEQLGYNLFSMALDTLIQNTPLGEENRIPESLVETSQILTSATPTTTASSSTSGCPDPTNLPLFCGYEKDSNCSVKLPDTKEKSPVCEDGDYRGCECNTPVDEYINMASVEEQQVMMYISELFKTISPSPTSPSSKPKCFGLQGNKYFTRDTLSDLIDNTYCPKWEGATGGIGFGSYLQGTPETVEIGIIGGLFAKNGVPTVKDCKKYLHEVLDGCDGDGSENPMNWKGGGELKIDDWTYSLRSLHDRPPAPKAPSAWCAIETCNKDTGCVARLWGAGWLNSGFGKELREHFEWMQALYMQRPSKLMGFGIDTSKWGEKFEYELMDGHEWTVTIPIYLGMFLVNGQNEMIETIMKWTANKKDLQVKCENRY